MIRISRKKFIKKRGNNEAFIGVFFELAAIKVIKALKNNKAKLAIPNLSN